LSSGYPAVVLGPLILLGLGIGLAFMPLNLVILAGLPAADTGSASGLLQCMQQLGIALGVAVLTTVYGTSLHHHPLPHAIAAAFIVSAALLAVAVLVAALAIKRGPSPRADRPVRTDQ
jgi:MFS family permease